MAAKYSPETRAKLREAYVHQRLALEIAAAFAGVSFSTAQKWKAADKKAGLDWDKERARVGLSAGNLDGLAERLLNDFLLQFQSTQELLNNADIDALDKVQALASLADSLTKVTSALRRLLPEVNRLAVAMELLGDLSEFIREEHRQQLPVFVTILQRYEPRLRKLLAEAK